MASHGNANISRRRTKTNDADLDITPMIDVTFLLLIFFMVTSTMHPARDKDIPAAVNGENANAGRFVDVSILSQDVASAAGQLLLEGRPVTLEQFARDLNARCQGGRVDLMIYAERDVRNGFVGEVEDIINGVEGEVDYNFAVRDRR